MGTRGGFMGWWCFSLNEGRVGGVGYHGDGGCMQLIVFFITSKFTSDFPCGAESKFPLYGNCMYSVL